MALGVPSMFPCQQHLVLTILLATSANTTLLGHPGVQNPKNARRQKLLEFPPKSRNFPNSRNFEYIGVRRYTYLLMIRSLKSFHQDTQMHRQNLNVSLLLEPFIFQVRSEFVEAPPGASKVTGSPQYDRHQNKAQQTANMHIS